MRGYDQRFAGARHATSLWFIQGHHRIEIADVQVLRENTGPILRLIRWNGHFACFGFGVTLVAFASARRSRTEAFHMSTTTHTVWRGNEKPANSKKMQLRNLRFPFRSNGFDHELIKRRKHGD